MYVWIGDKARVRFRFLLRPEFLHERTRFVFREGNTKGIGWVRKLLRGTDAEVDAMPLEGEITHMNTHKHTLSLSVYDNPLNNPDNPDNPIAHVISTLMITMCRLQH